jgi:hypothetical protein
VTSAKLRLYVTDPSTDGGGIYGIVNSWTETGITWANAPPIGGTPVAQIGNTALGTWIELDLGSSIVGNGTYSFGIRNGISNLAMYSSREGAHPPELVVTATS